MRKTIATAAAALLPLTPAHVAHAQLAPGYSGQSSAPREGTNDEFWWGLRNLGLCLAKSKAKLAAALLATEPNSKAESTASRALLGQNTSCLAGFVSMTLPTMLVRGAVAEGMYERTASAPPAPLASATPARLDRTKLDQVDPYTLLYDFARCYASIKPGEVHGLLADTKAGTKEEGVALGGMRTGFAACLPKGVAIEFEPGETRAALAEALYHRAAGGPPARPAS